ncbi:hypothetical protein GCM10009801_80750 [Streptomyces albiaxialis]|uniref:Uncharacterized protein n=1 Tax=Streptomyces albiaxialis TaxID=329523 RepID=A0ABN2X5W8_9ACTN
MGSLRNPIGPLPSSIYWRRRAVALAVLALLVLLIVWLLVSGGGDGGTSDEGKGGGNGPASTITPGPTKSGPVNSDRPGGRDEEDGDGGSGGSGGSGDEDGGTGGSGDDEGGGAAGGSGWGAGNGSGAGGDDGSAGSGGGGGGGAGGGSAAGKGAGVALPADTKLPDCADGDVELKLRAVEKKYEAGEKPKFRLTVENAKGSACKIDLGRGATVVTIKDSDDDKVWTSDDCLRDKQPFLRRVPAKGDSVHTLTWFGKPSAANCASPPAASAKAGDYEIEVKVKGLKTARTSFELT